ncbi:hypothetical protein DVQ19_20885 [Yersinia enterocolitica]|nr:hypothetical protein [Yersinia enterocolitica]EKN5040957.1 hypothetical protein [Yersinia enterocolitica]EKN5076167.1 hypothetical protein [Yersinia enterocolitica]EKN5103156.1 hypothetical protein [Yersinia enterocolitica]EKN5115837.1 hypothetical protein [Yersinia enterocolitica]
MSLECLKITARHNKDEEKEKINSFYRRLLIFNTVFAVLLSDKIKNSLEWLLVMDVTKRSNIAKIYKCISKIDDT